MTQSADAKAALRASIIVNNHNYGQFLRRAIDSALAQTYRPLEVIVVDDGSTDRSREIISSYGSNVVAVLKDNGGQASAFNAGLEKSKGDAIIFLDADDELFPDAVSNAVKLLGQPGVIRVHWPLVRVDTEGRAIGGLQPPREQECGDFRERVAASGPAGFTSTPTSGNAWTREFLQNVFPIPEARFAISSDAYLVTLSWAYGIIEAVTEPQGLYRVHGGNRFASLTREEQHDFRRRMFADRIECLTAHLRALGVAFDSTGWDDLLPPDAAQGSWLHKVQDFRMRVVQAVPAGSGIIVVDEYGLAGGEGNLTTLFDRECHRFGEADSPYAGLPENDDAALEELLKLRARGPDYLVFPWFTAWWLDHYSALAAYVRDNATTVSSSEEGLIFQFRKR